MRVSAEKIVANLLSQGYVHSSLVLATEGAYSVSDAEWNYKDALHHNYVHTDAVEQFNFVMDQDLYAGVWHMRPLGFQIPLSVMNFQPSPDRQVNVTPALGFLLVIENQWSAKTADSCRITTTYHICSTRWLRPFHPLLKWMLGRTYKKLMRADKPLRERRNELRQWGFTYTNEKAGHYGYDHAYRVGEDFVRPPLISAPASKRIEIDFEKIQLVGKSDHLGLRLEKEQDKLLVLPRICLHAGASLDNQPCKAQTLGCPWHGRTLSAYGSFDLTLQSPQHVQTPYHRLRLENNSLLIEYALPEGQYVEPSRPSPPV